MTSRAKKILEMSQRGGGIDSQCQISSNSSTASSNIEDIFNLIRPVINNGLGGVKGEVTSTAENEPGVENYLELELPVVNFEECGLENFLVAGADNDLNTGVEIHVDTVVENHEDPGVAKSVNPVLQNENGSIVSGFSMPTDLSDYCPSDDSDSSSSSPKKRKTPRRRQKLSLALPEKPSTCSPIPHMNNEMTKGNAKMKRKRKGLGNPETWRRNKEKRARRLGETYIGVKKSLQSGKYVLSVPKSERKLGARCSLTVNEMKKAINFIAVNSVKRRDFNFSITFGKTWIGIRGGYTFLRLLRRSLQLLEEKIT